MRDSRGDRVAQPDWDGRTGGSRIRGRDDELSLISDSLRRVRSRLGGEVILLEGAPGSGKTRLLTEACALARQEGIRVFHGGGDPDGQFVTMAPLLDALLSAEHPVLERGALRSIAAGADQRFWILQEIQNRLERAALEHPLLIAIDDAQWCDEATLTALRTLPERLSSDAVMWMVASRADADPLVRETLERLRSGGARTVPVSPLSGAAVAEVVEDLLRAPAGADVLEVAERAEGRPLLLVELIHGLQEEGSIVVDGDTARLVARKIPLRFRESIEQRLDQVSPTVRELIQITAALGRECPVGQLAELMRRPAADLGAAVREALATDLMVGDHQMIAFRHDLIREAVEAGLPATVRRALLRRAAELRLRHGVPETEVAAMVAAGAEPGDRWAVDVLRRAAADLTAGSPSSAARMSRAALGLMPGNAPDRGPVLAETIGLLWLSGRAAEARALGDSALEGLLDAEAEGHVRLGLAMVSSQHSFAEAVRQCRAGLDLPGGSVVTRARLLAVLCLVLANSGELEEAERTLGPALSAAHEAEDLAAEATVLSIDSVVRFFHFDMAGALARIEESIEVTDRLDGAQALWMPHPWRSMVLSAVGEADGAIELIDASLRQALKDGEASLTRLSLMGRCRLLLDAGRLSEAQAEAEAVLSMVDELGPGNYADATAQYTMGRVAWHRGDQAGIRAAAEHARRMMGDDAVLMRLIGAWLGALVADFAGDADAVARCTAQAARFFDRLGPALASPEDPMDEPLYVRIVLRAGLTDRAEAAARTAERRATANPAFPALAAAAAHARGLITDDVALLRRAAELYEGSSRRLGQAAALEDLGRVLAERRDAEAEAVDRLDRALELFAGAGADRDVDRVRGRLRALGVRRGPTEGETRLGLTPAEVKVVRLIAQGATNKAVAEALFLSPHTVSSHLRHAFVKLGINSRVELARVLAEHEDAHPPEGAGRRGRPAPSGGEPVT
ncbi:ATP-binding protein [Streptomyces sp. NPDC059894]|uniref:ATP-binding protein n=1 Tax=unclassified Streptomyces TaxID=2593676 RepID=UPI00365BB04C